MASTDQSVLAVCDPSFQATFPDPIVTEKEIIVRDLTVVEDPCRTEWTATGCATGTLGAWTFGSLMAGLAGETDVTSARSRQFVAQWLSLWKTAQVVGLDPTPVAPRTGIGAAMLNRWITDSGCTGTDPLACPTLDLKQAPFRLLAIVNRVDLDGRGYDLSPGAPGELRFVFGGFSRSSPSLPKNEAAVIFEYQYPTTFQPSWWADMFHNLSSTAFGAGFNDQLQSITNLVVTRGSQPGRGNNGSAIGQVRTNERAFDGRPPSSKQWEFRQFALPCTTGLCFLKQVPVSQTPATALNNTQTLTDFLVANKTAISTSRHVVPAAMLGGSSLSAAGSSAVLWNTTLNPNYDGDTQPNVYNYIDASNHPLTWTVRHNFAFSTCNGCHYLETSNENSQFHIAPRELHQAASVSGFLNRTLASSDGSTTTDYLDVTDQNPDSYDLANNLATHFQYNELWRRACEIRRVRLNIKDPVTTTTGHH